MDAVRGDEDLNRKNSGGWTPLMYACYIGHDTVVNLLLEAGVAVDARNNKGQTALTLAAMCGNESVAYFLLQVLCSSSTISLSFFCTCLVYSIYLSDHPASWITYNYLTKLF